MEAILAGLRLGDALEREPRAARSMSATPRRSAEDRRSSRRRSSRERRPRTSPLPRDPRNRPAPSSSVPRFHVPLYAHGHGTVMTSLPSVCSFAKSRNASAASARAYVRRIATRSFPFTTRSAKPSRWAGLPPTFETIRRRSPTTRPPRRPLRSRAALTDHAGEGLRTRGGRGSRRRSRHRSRRGDVR